MRKFISVILVLAIAGVVGCAKRPKSEIVATINGKDITMTMVDEKIENLPKYYQAFAGGHKKEVVDEMIVEELLYDEAKRRKLDSDSEIKELINEATRKILISKVIENETRKSAPVSEDDVRAHYEENKDKYMVPETIRASHILTSTEEDAKAAQEELNAGSNFADTAKKYSKDLTKDRGGDLGYFNKGQMIPEFEKACFSLNIGDVSPIIKTRFGYHIIELTDRKPATYRKFEEVKNNIMSQLTKDSQRAKFDEFTNKLRSNAKIEIKEDLLVPPVEEEEEKEDIIINE